ncbi:MAG: ATP-binding cassette domain-containing protein [Ignavibacteriales bacterium]|nr:ATP-binding cassette domain-containing protein [Ignavibacteriales bacterium]
MVKLSDVSFTFDGQKIFDRAACEIHRGEFVSLVGSTGSGKTTLLRLLIMDLMPSTGTVTVGNYISQHVTRKQIPLLRRKLGIVFQDFKLLEDRSVYDNVAFALYVTNARASNIRKRVLHALAQVGLSHKTVSMPNNLSGGEQQRVAVARALVNDPFLLLADEPTGNLDPVTSQEILKLLKDINAEGMTVLMATHNYDLVRKAQGRIVQIKDRKLQEVQLKVK